MNVLDFLLKRIWNEFKPFERVVSLRIFLRIRQRSDSTTGLQLMKLFKTVLLANANENSLHNEIFTKSCLNQFFAINIKNGPWPEKSKFCMVKKWNIWGHKRSFLVTWRSYKWLKFYKKLAINFTSYVNVDFSTRFWIGVKL